MFCLKLLSFLLTLVATCFCLISLLTNYWIVYDSTYHQGLYYFCNDRDIGCQPFNDDSDINAKGVPGWHIAVLSLTIITSILDLVAVLLFVIIWFADHLVVLNTILIIITAIGCTLLTTALSIFTRQFYRVIDSENEYKWGYSFILGWVSFCFNLLAVVSFFIYDVLKKSSSKYT